MFVQGLPSEVAWQPRIQLHDERLRLLFDLMRGHSVPLQDIIANSALVWTILHKPDRHILNAAQELVQDLLKDLFEQKALFSANFLHLEATIGDVLALYPYLGVPNGSTLQVPVRLGTEWKLIDYIVERIEMTPSWMGSPLVAYGLHALDSSAPPLLLFKGTTYPADEGASLSLLTDLNLFGSVGSYAFAIGKATIQQWLEQHTATQKAIVYGKSLGGAQAWRSALYFPTHIQKVMAIAAPGCSYWEQAEMQHVMQAQPHLEINIFCQPNDPVPYSDCVVCQKVNYYEMRGLRTIENPLLAHASMTSMQELTALYRLPFSAIASPWKRVAVTIARLAASIFFPLLAITHTLISTARYIHNIFFFKLNTSLLY